MRALMAANRYPMINAGKISAWKFFHGSSHGTNHPNWGNHPTYNDRNNNNIVASQKSGIDNPKIEKSQGKGKVQKWVGKDVSLLGFGVQAFAPGPVSDLTRTIAQEELAQPVPVAADKFVQVDQQAAGFCLGDSGGPVLEKKKDVVLAISSSNSDVETCLGAALAYRLDSEAAQSFIRSFS